MTDHLEEARGYIRANTETGFIIHDRVEASVAIVHALIAIAERIEPQTGDVEELRGDAELMRSVRNMYAKITPLAIPPETVPELLPEHRDREWVDKDGESWRWCDEVWQVYSPENGWFVAAEGHRASNYCRFGPFTAVPS